jgi:hypothetical protein
MFSKTQFVFFPWPKEDFIKWPQDHRAATSLLLANKALARARSESSTGIPARPSLKMSDSNMSGMSDLSQSEPLSGEDEDMRRARELVKLYAMRGKFKQMGDTGLGRAKERVDDVVQRHGVSSFPRESNLKVR